MRKTKTTLLLLAVALLVLALCACQPTIKVTFDLGYDGKTEVKTYQKGEKRTMRLRAPITISPDGTRTPI